MSYMLTHLGLARRLETNYVYLDAIVMGDIMNRLKWFIVHFLRGKLCLPPVEGQAPTHCIHEICYTHDALRHRLFWLSVRSLNKVRSIQWHHLAATDNFDLFKIGGQYRMIGRRNGLRVSRTPGFLQVLQDAYVPDNSTKIRCTFLQQKTLIIPATELQLLTLMSAEKSTCHKQINIWQGND